MIIAEMDIVEKDMMENDKKLEANLVTVLVQLNRHKSEMLQIASKMREQACHNQHNNMRIVDLLQKSKMSQTLQSE